MMGAISDAVFNFARAQMDNVMGQISQQASTVGRLQETAQGFGPKILMGWEGDDAQAFVRDLTRRFIPAVADLIAAISGANTNLTSAIAIMDKADSVVAGIADEAAQIFDKIF